MISELKFEKLRLLVRLGWGEEERRVPQAVDVSFSLRFEAPPRACDSDQLADTVCYFTLSERIRTSCASRSFNLIEALAQDVYVALRSECPKSSQLLVEITKVNPPIAGLTGGVTYRHGDASW